MMGHIFTKTDSGLLVAESRHHHDAVAAALRAYRDDLRLVPSHDPKYETVMWKVYSYQGPDRPAIFVLPWADDDGRPRPLSMGLLDMVKQHDPNNTRRNFLDVDTQNQRLMEQRDRDRSQRARDIADDLRPALTKGRLPVLHRGQHLNRSRHKRKS